MMRVSFKSISRKLTTTSYRHLATSVNSTEHCKIWTKTPSEFTVTPQSGFLPRHDPLPILPSYFDKLEEILHEMPISKGDGTYGLLHSGRFGELIEREMPLYDVDFIFDSRILSALFRDYTFLASAYLLEPCDIQYRLARNYGLARRVLPANIAVPLRTIAARINASPFLEHSMSYTFYNYRRIDASGELSKDNIEPIRRFSGCETEKSYIVGHVAAAQHTGAMVEASLEILRSAQKNDRKTFNLALRQYAGAMATVNGILSSTLKNTGEYASFRTFLSGCKDQPMFTNGVLFEGSSDSVGQRFLGVAQSSNPIASLSTHLFQLSQLSPQGTLPCTNGVDSLRPENYRAFLSHIDQQSRKTNVQAYALRNAESSVEYMAALDQVLAYRYRQWANLRDSIPVQTASNKPAFRKYFDVQTRHIRDVAELVQRTRANTDAEVLVVADRLRAESIVHRAEMVRRSLNRILSDSSETSPLPVSMIAY
ncbi:hypothetical protein LPJ64_005576 [Coemansia asiatica]|uniref:Uncharacterized protein n=1 Tax=Coemansia asiatica TaxID=1052880 RepID=A0A9W8CI09_9FUNG|nr:hypothetical protein LPJ64_005576 [Coemansia asiatica]